MSKADPQTQTEQKHPPEYQADLNPDYKADINFGTVGPDPDHWYVLKDEVGYDLYNRLQQLGGKSS